MQNFGINAAITYLGNAASLARNLGISRPAVVQWQKGERPVPPKRAVQIEALTKGRVSRTQLCPDWQDYWPDHSVPAVATDQPGTSPWHAKAAGASSAEDK